MATLPVSNCLRGGRGLPRRGLATASMVGLPPSMRPAAAAGGSQASGAASAGASVRWPFLRSKTLMAGISRSLAPGPGAEPRCLWVLGARGSGAGTAVQAAAAQALRAADGSVAATILFDCAAGGQDETLPKLFRRFEDVLQRQLAERFDGVSAPGPEQLSEAVIDAVLRRHPDAGAGLVKTVEAVAGRMGLAGVLPRGIDVPACREALTKHRAEPLALGVHAAGAIFAAIPRQKRQQFSPATMLHVVLVLLREAGIPRSGSEYLLTAAESLAKSTGRDVLLVLLRTEMLSSRSTLSSATPASKLLPDALTSNTLLRTIEEHCYSSGDANGTGSLRLLLQSRDMVAAMRAVARGDEVLTVDEWSEEMARALLVPRFLESESQAAWKGIWTAVGGHAAHLRQVAELLIEERSRLEHERLKEEREKQRAEALKARRPERSPDAEAFGKQADEQHEVDSMRADARKPLGAAERLLQRLPEVFGKEIAAFERQAAALLQHPLLQAGGRENLAQSPGQRVADLASKLQAVCAQPYTPAPQGGFAALQEPVLLALLDVGLLVPKWGGEAGPRLVLANQLSRSLLLAWVDAQCAELPWQQWFLCRWLLWSKSQAMVGQAQRK